MGRDVQAFAFVFFADTQTNGLVNNEVGDEGHHTGPDHRGQHGFGLEKAAEGCDLIIHLPAWHGIHWQEKTEADYWRLNVDGTFWAFQAARSQGVSKFLFLSSQAWHGHYHKYGFTKRIGDELCEYNRLNSGISYVAVRPADLTPWGSDWVNRYGARLLYGGVDRDDVLDCCLCAVDHLGKEHSEPQGIAVDALKPDRLTAYEIAAWETDPIGTCESIFPGSAELVAKYAIDIQRRPLGTGTLGWAEVGYSPKRHFGKFLDDLKALDAEGGPDAVARMHCEY